MSLEWMRPSALQLFWKISMTLPDNGLEKGIKDKEISSGKPYNQPMSK